MKKPFFCFIVFGLFAGCVKPDEISKDYELPSQMTTLSRSAIRAKVWDYEIDSSCFYTQLNFTTLSAPGGIKLAFQESSVKSYRKLLGMGTS